MGGRLCGEISRATKFHGVIEHREGVRKYGEIRRRVKLRKNISVEKWMDEGRGWKDKGEGKFLKN
jgi:hypothetical protein